MKYGEHVMKGNNMGSINSVITKKTGSMSQSYDVLMSHLSSLIINVMDSILVADKAPKTIPLGKMGSQTIWH